MSLWGSKQEWGFLHFMLTPGSDDLSYAPSCVLGRIMDSEPETVISAKLDRIKQKKKRRGFNIVLSPSLSIP